MPKAVARPGWTPGGSMDDFETWLTTHKQANPDYEVPEGYHLRDGRYERDVTPWWEDAVKYGTKYGTIGALGVGGGMLLAPYLGAAGAGSGMSWGTAAVPGGATQAGIGTTLAGSGGGGMTGWLAKNGLDLALAGMSMLGDDEGGGQRRQSYRGHGASDPVDSLNYFIQALQRMGAGLEAKPANRIRRSEIDGPAPVSAGMGQVGGALGVDPAQQTLLQGDNSWLKLFQPFQGAAQNQFGQGGSTGPNPGARRRSPGGR